MKDYLKFLLFFICPFYLASQSPSLEWEKNYGGTNADVGLSITQTSDGGYILAGSSSSDDLDLTINYGFEDFWVIKLNQNGSIDWQVSYGTSGVENAFSIQQTNDSGYIVAGSIFDLSGSNGSKDYWILKLDNTGSVLWEKSIGGSSHDIAYEIIQSNDGGYLVVGESSSDDGDVSNNYGGRDFWVVKLDALGNTLWEKSYGGSNSEAAKSIVQTVDGGYVISGYSNSDDIQVSGNHGQEDFWILKIDLNGNLIWQKSLGGSGYDASASIQQTSDGSFIVTGVTWSNDGDILSNHGGADSWVVKLDQTGNMIWENTFGGSSSDFANSCDLTDNEQILIAGLSFSMDGDLTENKGNADFWFLKLNQSGDLLWQQSYGGTNEDKAMSLSYTDDQGFIACGQSLSNDVDVSGNFGSRDVWVVKLSGDLGNIEKIEADFTEKKLIEIVDLLGRKTELKLFTTLIYVYSDGTTKKVFLTE